jgi:hypothetical protein
MILLFESKLDKQKFIDFAGKFTADDFFRLKPRMKPPYNDIYYWMKRPINELIDYLTKVGHKKSQAELRASAKGGARLVADEDGWKVLEIFNQHASAYYGRNTKWCISSTDGHGQLYWNVNTKKKNGDSARVFFFLHGNDEKYAVLLWTWEEDGKIKRWAEVWDQEDRRIDYLPDYCPVIDELAGTNAYRRDKD